MPLLPHHATLPSNAQLSNLLDAVDEILLLLDARQRLSDCNRAAQRLLGCSPGQPVDQALAALPGASVALRVMAVVDDRSLEDAHDLAQLEIGALMYSASVGVATLSVVTLDVTEQEQAHRCGEQLLRELLTILEGNSAGIAYLRGERLVRCNRRFEAMLGLAAGGAAGALLACTCRRCSRMNRPTAKRYRSSSRLCSKPAAGAASAGCGGVTAGWFGCRSASAGWTKPTRNPG